VSFALGALVSIVSLLVGGITIWLFARPGVRRVRAAADAILGEEGVRDRSGEVIDPPRPGLVHQLADVDRRVGTVEEAVVEFRHVVGLLTETQKRIDLLEHRLKAVEDSRLERLVNRAESAYMWRAVADADADLDDDPPGDE
jgi:hypothetical protein